MCGSIAAHTGPLESSLPLTRQLEHRSRLRSIAGGYNAIPAPRMSTYSHVMRHAPKLSRLSPAVRLTSRQPKAGRRAQTRAYPASLNQFRQLAGFPAVRNHHLHSRSHCFGR